MCCNSPLKEGNQLIFLDYETLAEFLDFLFWFSVSEIFYLSIKSSELLFPFKMEELFDYSLENYLVIIYWCFLLSQLQPEVFYIRVF